MPSGVPSDTVVASEGVLDADAGPDPHAPPPPATATVGPGRPHRPPPRFAWGLAVIALLAFGLRAGYVLATRDDTSLCQRLVCGEDCRSAQVLALFEIRLRN